MIGAKGERLIFFRWRWYWTYVYDGSWRSNCSKVIIIQAVIRPFKVPPDPVKVELRVGSKFDMARHHICYTKNVITVKFFTLKWRYSPLRNMVAPEYVFISNLLPIHLYGSAIPVVLLSLVWSMFCNDIVSIVRVLHQHASENIHQFSSGAIHSFS